MLNVQWTSDFSVHCSWWQDTRRTYNEHTRNCLAWPNRVRAFEIQSGFQNENSGPADELNEKISLYFNSKTIYIMCRGKVRKCTAFETSISASFSTDCFLKPPNIINSPFPHTSEEQINRSGAPDIIP